MSETQICPNKNGELKKIQGKMHRTEHCFFLEACIRSTMKHVSKGLLTCVGRCICTGRKMCAHHIGALTMSDLLLLVFSLFLPLVLRFVVHINYQLEA